SYRVILPDKGSRWVQGYAKPEKQIDGSILWHGYLVDNTEEMEVKKKLAENEEQLRLAVEATDAGLWDWDMKNDRVNFSKKWSAMLGYEENEISPDFSGWKRLWHPEDEVLITKSVSDFLDGKSQKYEIIHRMKTKKGNYKWIMTRGDVIRDVAGNPVRWVGTNIDITSRKEIEHQLERANIQLGKTIEEARSANKLKTAFLANISHEIRTPINAIIGFSYLLRKDTNLKEAQIEKVDYITKSAEHLLSLMNDVLDISKIESGVMELHMKRFSLNTLFQDIEVMLHQQAKEKGIQLIIHRLNDDHTVKGDYSKIMQVLLNLLSNGIKYTEEGKVELTSFISQKKTDQLQISFTVTDTGLGIPEEDRARLFDLFYHNNYGKKINGSGLGLQISKKYAEVMGGDITVESEVGTGSVFTFIITLENVSSLGLNVEYAKEKGSFSEVKSDRSRRKSSSPYKIPEHLFKDICSAAMRGDTSVLNREIEKVKKMDESAYRGLKKLADQFEYKKIIEWNSAEIQTVSE
ncbi:MAG: PAS domain-containing hybrid sensor histidine kinase/response regulator, partial [Clostridia bacterium]|nr:PAS domain-containing hybrid sensor histidine kinase/response regulator [Clostridia bacterium]